MQTWREDQLQSLLDIENEDELFQALTKMARDLGFDYCAYGARAPFPVSRPRIVTYSNYPLRWQAMYQDRGYLQTDPTVRHGMRSSAPVVWSDRLFGSTRQLWEEARSFGLNVGWAQSSWSANGLGGMLTVARSAEPLTAAELRSKGMKLSWLAQSAHVAMSQRLGASLAPETRVRLSDREIEVLKWTADGKTSAEISDILSISERTANFHIANAMTKLNAANRTAAVVLAATMGMLQS